MGPSRALACSLSVHRQLRPPFDPSSRSPALRAGNLRARLLARGPPWREREREFVGFLWSFLFQRLVLLCFCLTSLKFYYCISHVCCCHCCCVEVSNEAPPAGGGGGCSIPVFFSRSSLCSSAAASVLESAAAAIKLVEFLSLVLTWREEEEN